MSKRALVLAPVVMALGLTGAACTDSNNSGEFNLKLVSRISTGLFDDSAAEIAAYDSDSQRLFVVNGGNNAVDVFDVSDPANPVQVTPGIDPTTADAAADAPNSVAVSNGLVAVAIQNSDKQADGFVAIYNAADLTLQRVLTAGALPDMVTFTPDGMKIVVANEGEPNDDYTVDPQGSVSIVDLSAGLAAATITHADFTAFDGDEDDLRARNIRIFGPGATASQDLEPEYIAVSADSSTAWVVMQENNAMAIVDLNDAEIDELLPLGLKDHSAAGNELDASNRDDAINIRNWPIFGMYQPDSIAWYEVDGVGYIVTANEGDARDYDGFSEEARVKDLTLDPVAFFPDAASLQDDENLGRLKTTTANGDLDGDGDHDVVFAYGARSFSIYRASDMQQVFDSGADFENITASLNPDDFNSTDNENDSFDNRSDDKGPEPEALAVASFGSKTYAFIGLERMGGIMVYDISDPQAPVFVTYQNDRDYSVADVATDLADAGDLAPEGIIVIQAADSPNAKPLMVVASEVSGTTTIYEIENP